MGIRYIAIPINPLDVEEAQACPRCYLLRDTFPHGGRCDRVPSREPQRRHDLPEYLDLDKCWRELGKLFALPEFQGNPAGALVEGEVQHHGNGWIPYHGVLSPLQVKEASRGLRNVTESDIRDNIDLISHMREDKEQASAYVLKYLDDARTFTKALAQAGYGLIYIIG